MILCLKIRLNIFCLFCKCIQKQLFISYYFFKDGMMKKNIWQIKKMYVFLQGH